MTVESTRTAGSRWLALVLVVFVLGVGWRVLSLGMADHFAESDPGRALWWRSEHPEALLGQAEQLAIDPALADAAADLARRALHANPLDGRPYRVLAQLADAQGDRVRAAELFGYAVKRSPRDVESQAWLASHHLTKGDAAQALSHIDTLLRVRPSLVGALQPTLMALAAAPAAHAALAEKLMLNPPWRAIFLTELSRLAQDVDAISPLMDRLRQAPGGLAPVELGAWLDRLAKEQRWGQAYLTWASQLPPERQRNLGNIFNGGFEFEPGHGGFDWRISRVDGAQVDRLPGEGVGGRVGLRVAFDDRRVPFSHMRQLLALAPGRYRLSGRARADHLRSERGLVWTITCASGGNTLGETAPLLGNGPWRAFQAELEVPPEGCGGQWLTLRVPARIPAEQRIGGRAWFDDLKVSRIP